MKDNYSLNYSLPTTPNFQDQAPAYSEPQQAPKKGIMDWLTSPEIAQGFMGAGQAILNSGYGGNIGAGLGGFNEGMLRAQANARENEKVRIQKLIAEAQLRGTMTKNNLKPVETAQGVFLLNEATGQLIPAQNNGQQLMPYSKPQTVINNSVGGQEKQYAKTVGEEYGKSDVANYTKIKEAASAANQQNQSLDIIEGALKQVGPTGKLTDFGATVGNVLNQAIPGSVDKEGQKRLANISTAGAEMNKLLLPQTKSLGTGNGFTDKDREFLAKTLPQLGDTYEGNMQKIAISRKVQQRSLETAQIADDLRAKGASPFEINREVERFAKSNPLFPAAENVAKSNIGSANYNGQVVQYKINRK